VAGVDSGTRGTYYFDAFESRRQTTLGRSAAPPPPLRHRRPRRPIRRGRPQPIRPQQPGPIRQARPTPAPRRRRRRPRVVLRR
jgi:hypothetical protein